MLLAAYNLNGAIALTGSLVTPASILSSAWCGLTGCGRTQAIAQAPIPVQTITAQDQTINITSNGYAPSVITLKAGSQIALHLTNTGGQGCTQAFTIPKLGVQKIVPLGQSDTISFTAPSQPGQLAFMCSMGMYRGLFNIVS